MYNKKVNVNISAIFFHPCLDSHIPLLCVLFLHCTRTTEEVAFGIMMCNTRSPELFSKTGRQEGKKTKQKTKQKKQQIYRIHAGNIKKENADD